MKEVSEFVITAVKKGSDEPYLSAIFEDNRLISIIQNENISKEINEKDIASFLLEIRNDDLFFPQDIASNLKKYVTILPAKQNLDGNIIEIDF